MTPGRRASVKVRWERGGVIGPLMAADEARELTAVLLREVIDCGDSTRFVTVMGFDGRQVHVRGREVITVECVPEMPARVTPSVTTGGGGPVVSVSMGGTTAPAGATDFLRAQVARQSIGRDR